jgi:hypothetical protein
MIFLFIQQTDHKEIQKSCEEIKPGLTQTECAIKLIEKYAENPQTPDSLRELMKEITKLKNQTNLILQASIFINQYKLIISEQNKANELLEYIATQNKTIDSLKQNEATKQLKDQHEQEIKYLTFEIIKYKIISILACIVICFETYILPMIRPKKIQQETCDTIKEHNEVQNSLIYTTQIQ